MNMTWTLLAGILATGLAWPQGSAADLAGKKALMIVAHENFRDEELLEPKAALERNGVKVTVASSSLNEARGMLGATIRPDVLLRNVNPSDYDVVIFVGGPGSQEYFDDPAAQKLAQEAAAQDKLVCAICIAPAILANAGVLKGKKATCFRSESATLETNGARYTGEAVERDGKVITADGPRSAGKFAEAIIAALAEK